MMCVVSEMGRLLELHMLNRRPFMGASDVKTVRYGMRPVAKVLAEAPHWQIIETYWNTAMHQSHN